MSWPSATLGSIATIDRLSVQPSGASGRYIGLEHITSDGAINVDHGINAEDLTSSKFSFTPSHILFGKLRPYLRKVARPSFPGICSTDILPIHPNKGVDKDYLFHYLRTPGVIDLATARSSGANLPRISPSILSEFLVPVPPLEEKDESLQYSTKQKPSGAGASKPSNSPTSSSAPSSSTCSATPFAIPKAGTLPHFLPLV